MSDGRFVGERLTRSTVDEPGDEYDTSLDAGVSAGVLSADDDDAPMGGSVLAGCGAKPAGRGGETLRRGCVGMVWMPGIWTPVMAACVSCS